jgi:hypothetical protein
MTSTLLDKNMSMKEIITLLKRTEKTAQSRFRFGSPCRFIRKLDILVHVVLPEAVEKFSPKLGSYLRSTSPRWGRSWRNW